MKWLKYAVAWPLSWGLFYVGAGASWVMFFIEHTGPYLYPLYNWSLVASVRVQDWADLPDGYGPWITIIEVDLEDKE
jgi:hypothetical protein